MSLIKALLGRRGLGECDSFSSERLVKERHFLGRGSLKCLDPLVKITSLDRWRFLSPVLNSIEQEISERGEVVQLNGSTKGSRL
jgi:hypothetical protein